MNLKHGNLRSELGKTQDVVKLKCANSRQRREQLEEKKLNIPLKQGEAEEIDEGKPQVRVSGKDPPHKQV